MLAATTARFMMRARRKHAWHCILAFVACHGERAPACLFLRCTLPSWRRRDDSRRHGRPLRGGRRHDKLFRGCLPIHYHTMRRPSGHDARHFSADAARGFGAQPGLNAIYCRREALSVDIGIAIVELPPRQRLFIPRPMTASDVGRGRHACTYRMPAAAASSSPPETYQRGDNSNILPGSLHIELILAPVTLLRRRSRC